MAVAIVTDSAAALPPAIAEGRGITVVPMWLTIGSVAMRETDVAIGDLVTGPEVTTSGPTPGEFEAVVSDCRRSTDDGVVVLTLASTMSGTYEAAVLGARAAGGLVRVIDTTTAAGAEALVVLTAADAAAGGAPIADVEAAARRAIAQVRLDATVPNLDSLVRSGRVPNIAGWAGRHLGLAPVFEFSDGHAHALRPARGVVAARDRILARWRRDRVPGAQLHVAALHAHAEADAQWLLDRVRDEAEPVTAFVGSFGTVMTLHTGPGLVGLAWRWNPEET